MLNDIVVDTNVFLHSTNPGISYFEGSLAFLKELEGKKTMLCVDEGMSFDLATNSSAIIYEYLSLVPKSTYASFLLAYLFANLRFKEVSKAVPTPLNRNMVQRGVKARDKTFVKVTYNSADKIMVSHDYQDFPNPYRTVLMNAFGVSIINASSAMNLL